MALANGSRDARVCIGADSPDNLYQNATIDAAHTYRLLGKRGTVHYLGLSTNAVTDPPPPPPRPSRYPDVTQPLRQGSYGRPGGLSTVCYKEASELTLGADGQLEVLICTKAKLPVRPQPSACTSPCHAVLCAHDSVDSLHVCLLRAKPLLAF